MKIKKLVSMLAVCLLMTVVCCGCTKVYEVTDLETAYEKGYITQEDLKSIAYYYNTQWDYSDRYGTEPPEPDFDLIPKKELSKSTEKKIKQSFFQMLKEFNYDVYADYDLDDIRAYAYYGTYNNYAIAFIDFGTDYVYRDKTIGGFIFYSYATVYVYDLNS